MLRCRASEALDPQEESNNLGLERLKALKQSEPLRILGNLTN